MGLARMQETRRKKERAIEVLWRVAVVEQQNCGVKKELQAKSSKPIGVVAKERSLKLQGWSPYTVNCNE